MFADDQHNKVILHVSRNGGGIGEGVPVRVCMCVYVHVCVFSPKSLAEEKKGIPK